MRPREMTIQLYNNDASSKQKFCIVVFFEKWKASCGVKNKMLIILTESILPKIG